MITSFRIDDGHDLEFRVHFAISRNPYLGGRNVHCEVIDEAVILKGIVGTYYQKQMAQESLRKIDGVRKITNELSVSN